MKFIHTLWGSRRKQLRAALRDVDERRAQATLYPARRDPFLPRRRV